MIPRILFFPLTCIDPEKPEIDYVLLANKNLPKDIRVLAWCPVPLEFNPRRDCISRSYKYFFPAADLDIEIMRIASAKLVGQHDFRNFCSSQVTNGVVNHERIIFDLNITDENIDKAYVLFNTVIPPSLISRNPRRYCCLNIRGSSFLYHQIRCIASLLITVGRKLEPPEV